MGRQIPRTKPGQTNIPNRQTNTNNHRVRKIRLHRHRFSNKNRRNQIKTRRKIT